MLSSEFCVILTLAAPRGGRGGGGILFAHICPHWLVCRWPSIPANISTLFQRCLLVDTTLRRGTTSNQHWNNVVYFSVGIYHVEQRRKNVVYFNVDMNNVRQRRNNVVIFNVKFHKVDKRRNDVAKMTVSKKSKNKNISNRIQSFKYYFIIFFFMNVAEYLQSRGIS